MPPYPELPSLIGWTGHAIFLLLFLLMKLQLGKTGWPLFCAVELISTLLVSLTMDSCMFPIQVVAVSYAVQARQLDPLTLLHIISHYIQFRSASGRMAVIV